MKILTLNLLTRYQSLQSRQLSTRCLYITPVMYYLSYPLSILTSFTYLYLILWRLPTTFRQVSGINIFFTSLLHVHYTAQYYLLSIVAFSMGHIFLIPGNITYFFSTEHFISVQWFSEH